MAFYIENFEELATTDLRGKALQIMEAGLRTIDIEKSMESLVNMEDDFLYIKKEKIDLRNYKNLYLVGFGKGSFRALKFLEENVFLKAGPKMCPACKKFKGIVLDTEGGKLSRIKSFVGTHPLPSAANVKATEKIMDLLRKAKWNDLVLIFVFGGGSALLCAPRKVSLERKIKISSALLKSGATIQEMNTVRKHLSAVKGGQLAEIAWPAAVYSFICSDVPGNDLSVIASGPTVKDETTADDAEELAKKYGLGDLPFGETPKNDKFFIKTKNILLISNLRALTAMKKEARYLGFKTNIYSRRLQGVARRLGKILLSECRRKEALMAGGESTVYVTGAGEGGRNQEVVLGALESLDEDSVIISLASDGYDNSSASGAIADSGTLRQAEKLKLSPEKFLADNDSYNFFRQTGDVVRSRRGINISDLILVLKN